MQTLPQIMSRLYPNLVGKNQNLLKLKQIPSRANVVSQQKNDAATIIRQVIHGLLSPSGTLELIREFGELGTFTSL